jgi:hypothetical protein
MLCATSLHAQYTTTLNINGSGATCPPQGNTWCLVVQLPANTTSVAITLSGTWAATVQFEGTSVSTTNDASYVSLSTPSSTTNTTFTFVPIGLVAVRARISAFTSGVVTVAITTVTGTTGGSGGGSVTVGSAGTIVGGVGGGTAQAQTLNPSPPIGALVASGSVFYCWKPIAPNSGPGTTLSVSGLSAPITKGPSGILALIANDIFPPAIACAVYDGTEFQLQNPQAGIGALTSTTNYGAAAQALNLYVSNGCTNGPPPSCTGNFQAWHALPLVVASLSWGMPPLDGGVMTSDNAQNTSFSGDINHSPAAITIGSGTSIGSTAFCSTTYCPAGTYMINVYMDITTPCGTSGTYIVNLIYTDDQGLKTIPVNINGAGAVPATGVLTTTSTSNFGENSQVIRSTGATSLNYSTTATACGTAGPMVGKLYIASVRVGN